MFQFFRSFPGPPDVSEADLNILAMKYRDPDRPGLINYLNLHNDLQQLQQNDSDAMLLPTLTHTTVDLVPLMVRPSFTF